VARIAALLALVLAVVVVGVIVLTGGSSYPLSADFQDASGLVTGDNVLIGPSTVGSISSITLTRDGLARVGLSLHGVAPLPVGTVAHIAEDSLSGIASKYVELQPGPAGGPTLAPGAVIPEVDTRSEVNIDELFDTFDPLTRAGLSQLIRGESASVAGRGQDANRALEYLAPGLQSASQVTAELTRDQPAFDGLLVQGAQAMQALATRSDQLSSLVAHTAQATGAIAARSSSLDQALALLPATLRRSTATLGGLRGTLDALDPLVRVSIPAVRRLPLFLSQLRTVVDESVPTVGALATLVHNPAGTGDLTALALAAPSLQRIAAAVFPQMIAQFEQSAAQTNALRQYTPDVVAALTNLGQASAYYDANGHYARTEPVMFPFAINSANQLTTQPPYERYQGLHRALNRCPGAATQPASDGSSPVAVPGCSTSDVPPGP
jgi:phospholipid/cholesterol/gamma-HCH transport system substrate-binding protein